LRILDAGCGQGAAFGFFGRGVKVFGSDVSEPMLRDAVRRGPVTVQEPLSLPFADATFDAAFAFCIYHHIPVADHVAHLRELRRVVAPGGEVMVFEHNPYNPLTARIFARAPIDRGCEMIAPPALADTFRAAGFDQLEHGYLLFVPEWLQRYAGFLEPLLAWLPLGGQYFVAGRTSGPVRG
jgi:SAM-dependent methyltransferase